MMALMLWSLVIPVGMRDGSVCLMEQTLPPAILHFEICYLAPDVISLSRLKGKRHG